LLFESFIFVREACHNHPNFFINYRSYSTKKATIFALFQLAFESLALVSQALTLLEAGELGVVSFGEEPVILHQLGDNFNEESGAR